MQMTKLYILSCPEGRVRYVGKTVGPLSYRLSGHRSAARRGLADHRSRWLRSIGGRATIDLVAEVPGNGSREEIELIAGLRKLGARLTNCTDGGEGTTGRVFAPESIEKLRAAFKGRKMPPRSAETRARLSAALKGRVPPPHVMAACRAANLGKTKGPLSLECKAKIAATKLRITVGMLDFAREKVALGWSQQRAADALGVSQSQLSTRLRGRCR